MFPSSTVICEVKKRSALLHSVSLCFLLHVSFRRSIVLHHCPCRTDFITLSVNTIRLLHTTYVNIQWTHMHIIVQAEVSVWASCPQQTARVLREPLWSLAQGNWKIPLLLFTVRDLNPVPLVVDVGDKPQTVWPSRRDQPRDQLSCTWGCLSRTHATAALISAIRGGTD